MGEDFGVDVFAFLEELFYGEEELGLAAEVLELGEGV